MITNRILISGINVPIIGGNVNRTYLEIQNVGSRTFFLGGSENVTSGLGFPVLQGDTYTDAIYTGSYFGITFTGSTTYVVVIEEQQYPI